MAKPGAGDKDVAFDRVTPDEPGAESPGGGAADKDMPVGSAAMRDDDGGVHSDRVDGPQDKAAPQDDLLQSTELPNAPRRPR